MTIILLFTYLHVILLIKFPLFIDSMDDQRCAEHDQGQNKENSRNQKLSGNQKSEFFFPPRGNIPLHGNFELRPLGVAIGER